MKFANCDPANAHQNLTKFWCLKVLNFPGLFYWKNTRRYHYWWPSCCCLSLVTPIKALEWGIKKTLAPGTLFELSNKKMSREKMMMPAFTFDATLRVATNSLRGKSNIESQFRQHSSIIKERFVADVKIFFRTWKSWKKLGQIFLEGKRNSAYLMGSGCGSVGSAVACNSRGQQFESSHRQTFI